MRDLPMMNEYQQRLYCAMALVEEADLVAMFRALRGHPARTRAIDLVNAELDKGGGLMDAFGNEHSALCAHFECGMPDIEVFRRANGWVDLWFETDNAGDSGQWMFRFDGDTLIEAISHEEWYKRKGFN